MTVIIPILCVVIALGVIELLSMNTVRRIAFRCEANMNLTEPDETATLSYRVYNTSSWPIMFVGFSFRFDDAVEVRESEEWKQRYSVSGTHNLFGRELFLLPHRGVKGTVSFSLKQRGVFSVGKVYLETGDFLGLKTDVVSRDLGQTVVCTAKLLDQKPDIRILGGLLGEFTAQRFICDDPSLVLGYREYTGREPLKDISWLQTAKLNRLMVKNHDFTVDRNAAVLVDIEPVEKATMEHCLSLVRTVCEYLEAEKIPYAFQSNGDLFETERGVGRKHLMTIQRRIGRSNYISYQTFDNLVTRMIAMKRDYRGYIVIVPQQTKQNAASIARLRTGANAEVYVLAAREEERL